MRYSHADVFHLRQLEVNLAGAPDRHAIAAGREQKQPLLLVLAQSKNDAPEVSATRIVVVVVVVALVAHTVVQ